MSIKFRHSSNLSRPAEGMAGLRLSIWASVVVMVLFMIWASLSNIDQITRAQGQIIPSSRTQIIQAPDGGVIENLMVREGAEVQRGDLLVRFDKTKVEAAYRESEFKVAALSVTVDRLNAEVFGGSPNFSSDSVNFPELRKNQLNLLSRRRISLEQELRSMQEMRNLAQRELMMTEPLLQTGDVSMAEVLKLKRLLAEQEGQIANRRNKYQQESQAEFNKAGEELSAAREAMVQRKNQLDNTELRAPVNGTVKNVRVTTRGGVLRPGDELMQIVPVDDALIVEAKVKPADVAFLRPGQEVTVKIDSYDYTIYGTLTGKLTYISADTLNEDARSASADQPQTYYRVQVKTDSSTFNRRPQENLQLQAGMTATIEVKTGSNTILNYLLKPIIKTLNESLGER